MNFKIMEDGKEINCNILLTFRDENNDRNYIIYTDGTLDEDNEPLIYGYDLEKEAFIASVLIKGTFREVYLNFANVEASFGDMLEFYMSNPKEFFERKRWFLGITLFSPKDHYVNVNEEYDLVERLEWELSGTVYKKSCFFDPEEHAFFTGLSAVKKFYDVLSTAIKAEELN